MVGNRRRHDGKSRERCERQASIAGRIGGSVESPGFYRALVECPECDGTVRSDERRNERVCRACGLVVATDHLARGPTKHGPADGDTGQVTTPVTVARHDRGLGTLIDWRDRDANGNWMSEAKRRRIARLRTYNRRCRSGSGKKRTVQAGLVEIARLTSELDLPDVVQDDAAILFRRAVDQDLLVGRSVEGIAGACTYAAARRHGLPRTLDELTALSHVDRTKVGRGYRYISRELELTIPPVDPKSHVRRLVATLGYGRNVHRRACDFVDAADSASTVVGARPLTVACGSLYAATLVVGDEELTQAELADTAGLSTHTLRRRYRDVLDAVDGPPIRETSDPTADVS